MKKGKPTILDRDFDRVVTRPGFYSSVFYDLIEAGWCVESKEGPGDIPEVAHWQILILDTILVSDGREGSDTRNIWKVYIFAEKPLWLQVVQAYYDDAADQTSPTYTAHYNNGPMKLVALESSGRVIPHVSVALTFTEQG